jgi:hypothetical protein
MVIDCRRQEVDMPEEQISPRQSGVFSRASKLIGDYETVTVRDHWVDAVAERLLPPAMLAVLGTGLSVLGCLFDRFWLAIPTAVVALFAAALVVRIWRKSSAARQLHCLATELSP